MDTTTDAYLGQGQISTQSGTFDLENPVFVLDDIAHALAMLPRYNGHSRFPVSVAAHSLTVVRIMEIETGGDPREGLMHDGTEAYLSDVPRPFKQFLPDWREIDDRLDTQMREDFGIGPKSEECKIADAICLFIEGFYVIPDRGAGFLDPYSVRDRAMALLRVHRDLAATETDWQTDKGAFLLKARELGIGE